jgi:ribosomal protein S18 acetylase RimI-like enzyme
MPLTVRPAVPSDADTIVEFNLRLARETENKALDPAVLAVGVAGVLTDPGRGRYFVAEENGEVIGQMMITYEWSDWRNGWVWWLQSVYVKAEARSRGVFRAIFEFVAAESKRARNVVGMRLYVERENRSAQATYRRLGFEEMHFCLFHRGVS